MHIDDLTATFKQFFVGYSINKIRGYRRIKGILVLEAKYSQKNSGEWIFVFPSQIHNL